MGLKARASKGTHTREGLLARIREQQQQRLRAVLRGRRRVEHRAEQTEIEESERRWAAARHEL